MAIPLEYSPLTKVVPCDPDRLPHLPVQVLYLIAKALPQPSQIFNLARINKATWDYLQPAFYECEVTYEARLVARFGNGLTKLCSSPNVNDTVRSNDNNGDVSDIENVDQGSYRPHCAHGLAEELCEVCGQRIAIEDQRFWSGLQDALGWRSPADFCTREQLQKFFKSPGMTALHWACRQGEKALPVAQKAIEAAKTHQPAYINGQGLRMRYLGCTNPVFFGEIPPPLFTAVAFGNTQLCEKLIEAGCNLNLAQGKGVEVRGLPASSCPHFQIHESCVRRPKDRSDCQGGAGGSSLHRCQTAGHIALDFKHADILGFLLDRGLDPQIGQYSLMHKAILMCDLAAIKILLDRSPEMISHRWLGLTCLHVLCQSNIGRTGEATHSLQKLESVAAYLVQKGANLEAKAGPGIVGSSSPLQFTIMNFTCNRIAKDELYAAEAIINLGAAWNQPPTWSTDTILEQCVRQATYRRDHINLPRRRGGPFPPNDITKGLAFAKVVKAIIRSTQLLTPVAVPAQGTGRVPPMRSYLEAFKMLMMDSEKIPMHLDTFAVEAVGRLFLSTGISPDQGDIEKWNIVLADNAEGQKEWAASPWRELIADLSPAAPATMLYHTMLCWVLERVTTKIRGFWAIFLP